MKAILISIKPKWVAKILNGEKTIEIRKTCPDIFKHLKPYEGCSIDVYIYCSKGNKNDWHLIEVVDTETGWEGYEYDYYVGSKGYLNDCLEGKIVAKFALDKIRTSDMTNCLQGSCLSHDEVNEYTKGKKFYGWVIDNLVIFDKPKELSEFEKVGSYNNPTIKCKKKEQGRCNYGGSPFTGKWVGCEKARLTKAPQSWCYVEELL